MLVVRIKKGETASFEHDGKILKMFLKKIEGDQIQVSFDAPIEVKIKRTQLKKTKKEVNGNR